MTRILAFDVATRTGWALGEPGQPPRSGAFRFGSPGCSENALLTHAYHWFLEIIMVNEPQLIVMEATLPNTFLRGKTTKAVADRLIGLQAILRVAAFKAAVYDIRTVQPNDVRAHFIDMRRAKRKDAKRWVLAQCSRLGWLPEDCKDEDQADALAIWSWQCAMLDPVNGLRVSPLFQKAAAI
jgi:hypothetical protein